MHLGNPQPAAIRRLTRTVVVLFAAIIVWMAESGPQASASTGGELRFIRDAKSSFDPFITGATVAQRQWMNGHYEGMRGYSPFFDQALPWAPPSQFYMDLYAIYNNASGDQVIAQHPDWVLRDAAGKKLFIQWGCSGGTCPQYAADIGHPGFRSHWIEDAREQLEKGYDGIFIDDVNLAMKVSNGNGAFTRPLDPRTGSPMTDADWRRYVAEFTEEIRAAFPDATLSHNTYWRDHASWRADSFTLRELAAADVIEIERGFNDGGIVGGEGTYGFETYLSHMDWLHSRGLSIMYQPYGLDWASREFEVASYYLVNDGGDSIVSDFQADPTNWWPGWDMDLGAPAGPRYEWNALLRRDFASGMVLVNQPGAAARTVTLPENSTWTDLAGNNVTSVTLGARRAKVLRKGTPAAPPDTTPPQTAIDSGPAGVIPTDSASFGFSSSEPGSSFECRLDGAPWSLCSSPSSYSGLADGSHGFQVRARDAAGNADATPASRNFQVKRAKKQVTITPGKARVPWGKRIVLAGVAESGKPVEIERRNGRAWRTVAAPLALGDGSYRIKLRARPSGRHRYRATTQGLEDSSPVTVRVIR
jgi:Hypothetical glycosyl hydrolase family 15